MQEFTGNDYELASTNQIVEEAGISKVSFFYYFKTKKELYKYLIEYSIDYITEEYLNKLDFKENLLQGGKIMTSIEEYLATIDNSEHRQRIEKILDWIASEFSDLELQIKWNQPMFVDHGTFIIGFSLAKNHISVAPEKAGMRQFADEIAESDYNPASELFRIKWGQPVNYRLLEKMIKFNIDDKADCQTFWRKD